MTVQCCRCGKVRTETGGWTQPETRPQDISHSYCEPCETAERARVYAEIAFFRAAVAAA